MVDENSEATKVFANGLTDHCHKKLVTVEFFCGQCCKKAIKGVLAEVNVCFIVLVKPEDKDIKVVTFGMAGPIDTEFVEKIIIPVKNICSIEVPSRDHLWDI